MNFDKPIIQVMSANLVTIKSTEMLSEARRLFDKGDIHHLPVLDGKKLVGIVSSTDLVKLSLVYDSGNEDDSLNDFLDRHHTIESVMQKKPFTIGVEATVREAAAMLATGEYHALPVVGYDGVLKGIVTSTDLIKLLTE